nr:hypothetical protein [Candidatus Freyrarchaeum guaymaensis]
MSSNMMLSGDDLEEIKSLLETMKELIERIEVMIRGESITEEENMSGSVNDKRLCVLKEIYDRGGVVDRNEFYQIGENCGYSRKGLGGFFVGRRRTLTYISGGKVALTQDGEKELRKHNIIS